MDVAAFCGHSNVIIVAGKGGVGKTTVTATLALTAARAGLDVMLLDLDGRSGAASLLGHPQPLDYHPVNVVARTRARGSISARVLTPDDTLIDYLADHGLGKVSRRLASTGALDVVATAVPGIRDILVLGKVKQLERASQADLLILDAAAAGHALTFLTSAAGLADAARVGPIRNQANEVLELLSDPSRCEVMLVALAEETPVSETIETAFKLEEQVGVGLTPVVMNGLYPKIDGLGEGLASHDDSSLSVDSATISALRSAAMFRDKRVALQRDQIERLADQLPLPQLHLPYLFRPASALAEIETLASSFADAISALPSVAGGREGGLG